MSTGKINITASRIALLSAQDEQIFHAADLANLWLIYNKNTLYTLLKRYTQAGILYRLYKGLYSLLPFQKLDPLLLGAKALHQFCYVSTETVLYREGYISQKPTAFTFLSAQSLKFKIGPHQFVSRQLSEKFLYQAAGIVEIQNVRMATPVRAIADMLYLNPHYHFDKRVNWKKIKSLQQKIGYPLTPNRYAPAKSK